ncbi:MAG: hypothetical protein BalsKO_13520 [Balneolaceae bacterium]
MFPLRPHERTTRNLMTTQLGLVGLGLNALATRNERYDYLRLNFQHEENYYSEEESMNKLKFVSSTVEK